MGIEYLLFEELVLSSSKPISEAVYRTCLKSKGKLEKQIRILQPDYEKLKEFAVILAELDSNMPKLIHWDIKKLMKQWGILSSYLHWHGANSRTSGSQEWLKETESKIEEIVLSLWSTITSGNSGIMKPENMDLKTKDVWNDFQKNKINNESAKLRLTLYFPNTK